MIKVKLCSINAQIPRKAYPTDAGFDLYAAEEALVYTRKLISTGIQIAIPEGYYGRIAPRSGMSVDGIDVGAGVIDASYRGIVKVLLINTHHGDFYKVNIGDKIAQLIITKISDENTLTVVDELDDTQRGQKGFGSTDSKDFINNLKGFFNKHFKSEE